MAGGLGGHAGGIHGLIFLIEEHRAALQYDLRTRLGISVEDAGVTETWQDMLGFIRVIRADPGSQTAAAIEGWEYPVDRMDAVMRDLFDLQYAKTGAKNRKPYDRPWGQAKTKQRMKPAKSVTQEQILRTLAAAGH